MKLTLTILSILLAKGLIGQVTFKVDTGLIEKINFASYKVFIVSSKAPIDFIGRLTQEQNRFTPQRSDIYMADSAIQSTYAISEIHQLDKQRYNEAVYIDSAERKRVIKDYQKNRPRILRHLYIDQKNKLSKFDRYFWGYTNADNEKLMLIRFDPHKVKYYTISGEALIDTPPILVYNLTKQILSVAGWADFKE